MFYGERKSRAMLRVYRDSDFVEFGVDTPCFNVLMRYHIKTDTCQTPMTDTPTGANEECGMKREQSDKSQEAELYEAILQLKSKEEVESFFRDLCTPAELEGLVDRWRVACMLNEKIPYRQISAETSVSTATIVRVARFLNNGHDGYRTVMKRLGKA